MADDAITRREHEEFARRIDEENTRQNRRLSALEENVKEIHGLTLSVERMAANMENMLAAIEWQGNLIEKQNGRIDKMEKEPAGQWQGIKKKAVETAVTVIVTALTIGIVALIAQYIK